MRAEKPLETAPSTHEPSFSGAYAAATPGLNRLELLNQKIDGLQEQGKSTEALDLSDKAANVAKPNLEQHPVYAVTQERKATILQQQGELDRACRSLSQAYNIRKQELGPQNQETAKTANSLADMYAVALNTGNRISTDAFVLSPMVAGTAADAKDKAKNEGQHRASDTRVLRNCATVCTGNQPPPSSVKSFRSLWKVCETPRPRRNGNKW